MTPVQIMNILAGMPKGIELVVRTVDGREYKGERVEWDRQNGLVVLGGDEVAIDGLAVTTIMQGKRQ